ncbi:hypothetical protein AAG906_012950 [Vitis piasezkii]
MHHVESKKFEKRKQWNPIHQQFLRFLVSLQVQHKSDDFPAPTGPETGIFCISSMNNPNFRCHNYTMVRSSMKSERNSDDAGCVLWKDHSRSVKTWKNIPSHNEYPTSGEKETSLLDRS